MSQNRIRSVGVCRVDDRFVPYESIENGWHGRELEMKVKNGIYLPNSELECQE